MPLLHQYIFLIPLVVMVLTEITKVIVAYFRTGSWHAGIFKPGGMPSSHSAFVTSLLMIVARKTGLDSVEFAIAFVFAAIVWYDAMSVRREVGLQAEMLNRLQNWTKFSERVGHSFLQVIVGIMFGAVVTQIGIWLS
ncbi:MAG TPA: divergent PAP2 family protein [Candidatus Peribacteraceae bacterium]|nr:divergent PAP2 family protein [Candidatus Peribacteraceae bacterium]